MPFDFLRRRKPDDEAAGGNRPGEAPRGVGFDGLTEEWRIVGRMETEGRLSDVLNRREPLGIAGVSWAPLDGSAELTAAPGIRTIDPYDLIVVLAGDDTLPPLTEEERVAHRVHKIAYDVRLELPPFKVVGTIYLYPGADPSSLLQRATEMFVPVVDAIAYHGDTPVSDEAHDVILVNRFYLRGIEQVDKRTGMKPERLPGLPLGGTSWQETSK